MVAVLVFALTLFLAVLLSQLAQRTVLSIAVLFLVVGFVTGHGVLGFVPIYPSNPVIEHLANYALFTVLFTDGMKVSVQKLTSAWHGPGRALLLGMPMTLLGIALFAHLLVGLSWLEALLVGAVLSPTDPVFAAAIVGREEIPYRLRHLLNVESGMNDGLALPVVLTLLAIITKRDVPVGGLFKDLGFGVLIGVALPWAAALVSRARVFAVAASEKPLFAFAVGLSVLAVTALTGANQYLAAFAAGITLASVRPHTRQEFKRLGEVLTKLLKLATLLVFGAAISPQMLAEVPLSGYFFAVLALVVARPATLELSLLGSAFDWRERLTAAWFGPKGFSSVIYGLFVLKSGIPDAPFLFHLIAIVIAMSIVAHSSTDTLVVHWFGRIRQAQQRHAEAAHSSG